MVVLAKRRNVRLINAKRAGAAAIFQMSTVCWCHAVVHTQRPSLSFALLLLVFVAVFRSEPGVLLPRPSSSDALVAVARLTHHKIIVWELYVHLTHQPTFEKTKAENKPIHTLPCAFLGVYMYLTNCVV